jgi:hypothetical protein
MKSETAKESSLIRFETEYTLDPFPLTRSLLPFTPYPKFLCPNG